jgi:hypothetical protein
MQVTRAWRPLGGTSGSFRSALFSPHRRQRSKSSHTMRENPTESLFWVTITITLWAILTFVLYNSDSSQSINLSAGQIRLLPVGPILVLVLAIIWQETVDFLFLHGPFIHCAYISSSSLAIYLDLTLCAFTRSSREKIAGTIPLWQSITDGVFWISFYMYKRPVEDIPLFIATVCVFIGKFPDYLMQNLVSKLRIRQRYRLPYLSKKLFLAAASMLVSVSKK